MIYKIINDLKILAINQKMVNLASYGDIQLYNHKKDIKYPYINLDVINSFKKAGLKTYVIRVYVCDRNEAYLAYNKCEQILDELLRLPELNITDYTTNFFTLDFQDDVNGVWVDINLNTKMVYECSVPSIEENGYILMENGDLIKTN